MGFLLHGNRVTVMEKKLTNSGPFIQSTRKHSIYTLEQQQQRQDRAHQRYLSALRTLAQVQKVLAAKPTVQVNVAQNQINMS